MRRAPRSQSRSSLHTPTPRHPTPSPPTLPGADDAVALLGPTRGCTQRAGCFGVVRIHYEWYHCSEEFPGRGVGGCPGIVKVSLAFGFLISGQCWYCKGLGLPQKKGQGFQEMLSIWPQAFFTVTGVGLSCQCLAQQLGSRHNLTGLLLLLLIKGRTPLVLF